MEAPNERDITGEVASPNMRDAILGQLKPKVVVETKIVDTSDIAPQGSLLEQCLTNRAKTMEEKTIVEDSVRTKIIESVDLNLMGKLFR